MSRKVVNVEFPTQLVEELDEAIKGHYSRSEAVREAVRRFIKELKEA